MFADAIMVDSGIVSAVIAAYFLILSGVIGWIVVVLFKVTAAQASITERQRGTEADIALLLYRQNGEVKR